MEWLSADGAFWGSVSPSADGWLHLAQDRSRSRGADRTTRAPLRAHHSSRCNRTSFRYSAFLHDAPTMERGRTLRMPRAIRGATAPSPPQVP